jgi:hypothetical protein
MDSYEAAYRSVAHELSLADLKVKLLTATVAYQNAKIAVLIAEKTLIIEEHNLKKIEKDVEEEEASRIEERNLEIKKGLGKETARLNEGRFRKYSCSSENESA